MPVSHFNVSIACVIFPIGNTISYHEAL
jgi:hypothetical protein